MWSPSQPPPERDKPSRTFLARDQALLKAFYKATLIGSDLVPPRCDALGIAADNGRGALPPHHPGRSKSTFASLTLLKRLHIEHNNVFWLLRDAVRLR